LGITISGTKYFIYFRFERKTGAGTGRERRARPQSNIMTPYAGGFTIGLIGILIRNDGRRVSAGATIIFSVGLVHVAVFFPVRTTELISYAAKVPTGTKGVTGWLHKSTFQSHSAY
jgi:hypothetical protein